MGKEKKYTVLTYIFGDYEKLHEVMEKDPGADYVAVTDDATLKSDTWRVVYDPMTDHSTFGKCYEVRFHPWRYAKTDIVLRVDGSIIIRKPLRHIIGRFEEGGYDRCLMIHPTRNDLRNEYDVWVRTRGYPRQQAERCLRAMIRMGYDLDYKGLYQGCFEIQRRNDVNNEANDFIFGLLCLLSSGGKIERVDQTVTSFVLNKWFSTSMKVLPVSERLITGSEWMQWCFHGTSKPIPMNGHSIAPVLFNHPCETEW